MSKARPLILLDRDGVLNEVVVDPEQGTIDSPLHPSQVVLLPGVPESLSALQSSGFGLAIVTNQPAAAKGKTTQSNLEAVHNRVLQLAQSGGAEILSSHICFHRKEDNCTCRKPKTQLLREAFEHNPWADRTRSWMIGDGVTDIQAGVDFGISTAFLGPRKCDACKIFERTGLEPDFWGGSLPDFTRFITVSVQRKV